MRFKTLLPALGFCLLFVPACNNPKDEKLEGKGLDGSPRFSLLSESQTGIQFLNRVQESDTTNYFYWMYIYNGSGVAAGDINNDGLTDLYFTGNQVPNKLYLNKGGLKFEDITQSAGVAGSNWSAGATMADVNGDGLLDIYVSRGGPMLHNLWDRTNLLYINNGNLKFTESAQQWGCNDAAFGTHATFLDYDLDGDLDLYTCNHAYTFGLPFQDRLLRHKQPQPFESGRFFRNDGGKFSDITESSGVLRYSFSLSATAGDLNQDGYPDLYVANDFAEPDFMFINQKDGTFKEQILDMTGHISNFGMGNDIADFNNDGLLDVVVVDMMAESNRRKKTNMSGMNPELFWNHVDNGFHYQYMQNTLLMNQGMEWFSDVAQLAGVSSTDWSWAPLFADFDNDGWQDLFITNGYRRDARDNDYGKKAKEIGAQGLVNDFQKGLGYMPEERLPNYMYQNQGGMRFQKVAQEWGLSEPTWSNGATYADLDNDGDLDLVVCNLDSPVMVYQNNTQEKAGRHWLRVKLKGKGGNQFGLGAKVRLYQGGQLTQMRELTLSRGYQSSVEPVLHFGLGDLDSVDMVEVTWPDRSVTTMEHVPADQLLEIVHDGGRATFSQPSREPLFQSVGTWAGYAHKETVFDDFKKEILIPHRMSQLGPKMALGDGNGDGQTDLYVGNAKGQAGMWLGIDANNQPIAVPNKKSGEELGALVFDANGDGAMDLLTLQGGSEYGANAPELAPILYLSKGKGNFPVQGQAETRVLSMCKSAASTAAAHDFDGDGDQDVFIGSRHVPGEYPFAGQSYLLQNDGKGNFKDVTEAVGPGLARVGMVTSALWVDVDGDKDKDLVLAGEWIPLSIFKNEGGKFSNSTADAGLATHTGWWFSLAAADLDNDGDMDLVGGNMGQNSKYPASEKEPFEIYCHDFDGSGSLDIVLGYYSEGQCYPVRGRTCSSQQMPFIKEKFPTYAQFGTATLRDIYGDDLDKALHLQATTLASAVFINDGKGHFKMQPLPDLAQISATNGIIVRDFNGDKKPDLLIAGNLYATEVETSRDDAGVGLLLLGDGKGGFTPLPGRQSGFFALGDVKDLVLLEGSGKTKVVAAQNNSSLKVWEVLGN